METIKAYSKYKKHEILTLDEIITLFDNKIITLEEATTEIIRSTEA